MKKLVLISLALVMAIGAMGVGYALWSDSLYLEGTVETGDIGLEWSQGTPYDDETKDVSRGECYIIDDTLYINVYNAYPCVTYTFPLDLHGIGSIPVHTKMTIVGGSIDPLWVTMPDLSGLQIHQSDTVNFDLVIHLDNSADQLAVYTLEIQLDYWQYNEDDVALPQVPF